MTILDGNGSPVTAASPFVVGWVYFGLFGGFVVVSTLVALVFRKPLRRVVLAAAVILRTPAVILRVVHSSDTPILFSRDCRHLGLGWCNSGDCLPNRHIHYSREDRNHGSSARDFFHKWLLNILRWDDTFTLPGPLSDPHHL